MSAACTTPVMLIIDEAQNVSSGTVLFDTFFVSSGTVLADNFLVSERIVPGGTLLWQKGVTENRPR